MKNLFYILFLFIFSGCKTYDSGVYLYEEAELLEDGRVKRIRYWIENGNPRIQIDTLKDRYSDK